MSHFLCIILTEGQGLLRGCAECGESQPMCETGETPGQGVTLFKGLGEGREMAFFLKIRLKLRAPAAFKRSLGS